MPARLDEPGEDVLSDMVAAPRAEPQAFSLDEVARLGAGLLFAGHETTVTAIDSGIVQLSTHPEQRAALRADPALVDTAIEEILRTGFRRPPPAEPREEGLAESALARWANADLEIAGTRVAAGEMVLLSLQRATDSPQVIGDSSGFDLRRQPNPHLAFGCGLHFCIGAPLARLELHVLFGTLLERFPELGLAVSVDQLRYRPELLIGGVAELPVTW